MKVTAKKVRLNIAQHISDKAVRILNLGNSLTVVYPKLNSDLCVVTYYTPETLFEFGTTCGKLIAENFKKPNIEKPSVYTECTKCQKPLKENPHPFIRNLCLTCGRKVDGYEKLIPAPPPQPTTNENIFARKLREAEEAVKENATAEEETKGVLKIKL